MASNHLNFLLLTGIGISAISLAAWVYLTLFRGLFWRTDQRLQLPPAGQLSHPAWPRVSILVPARNEAALLPFTLPSLLKQDYPGEFHIFLVDDSSEDDTGEIAAQIAAALGFPERLTVIAGRPKPAEWTGKLWAVEQGFRRADNYESPFLLFTDADILHPSSGLRALVHKAQAQKLDLVSLMVKLRAQSVWEKLWLAAFVYFFAKLYPFRRVNDDHNRTAAAAGGVLLLRKEALLDSGGLAPLSKALIDDCALAAQIKRKQKGKTGKIWLGLAPEHESIRAYHGLQGIWSMVSRTAYAQLNYSVPLLAATILGMLLLYLVPPASGISGLLFFSNPTASGGLAACGLAAWLLMASTFLPLVRWYDGPAYLALFLPVAGFYYTLMTIDSAIRHWLGRGGGWKGRFHQERTASP